MMKRFAIFAVVILTCLLYSCSGDDQRSQIELFQPDSIRQTLDIDTSNLLVQISVNSGSIQSFSLNGSASTSVVQVSGIRPGEQNDIVITWIEVVDGRNIRISEQRQSFNADGNTIINAPHEFSVFDDDNDSVSNFDERVAGTCVWCDISDNLFNNGDFSDSDNRWFNLGMDASSLGGEFCITSPSSDELLNTYLGYSRFVPLDIGINYVFSFDIKADAASTVDATANNIEDNGQFTGLFDQTIDVSTNYQRREVPFSVFRYWPNARFSIVFLGNRDGQPVRYCVDNISLSARE